MLRNILLCAAIGANLAPMATANSAATNNDPEVWIGAPFSGNWPSASGCTNERYPSLNCSLPEKHWTPYGGDWAVDLPKTANTSIYLFAAPQVTSNALKAKVETISNACKTGDGGKVVTIGLYIKDKKVGWLKYSHVTPAVKAGTWVEPWGTRLGAVFSTGATQANCWYGSHLHLEFYNAHNYACYNKGWKPGQAFTSTNFLGFVGGRRVTAQPKPCP